MASVRSPVTYRIHLTPALLGTLADESISIRSWVTINLRDDPEIASKPTAVHPEIQQSLLNDDHANMAFQGYLVHAFPLLPIDCGILEIRIERMKVLKIDNRITRD
jgi:hypothetical protein